MSPANDSERKPVEFTIPARYYARGAVDWDDPAPEKTGGETLRGSLETCADCRAGL